MFGTPKNQDPRRTDRKRRNMEFDFAGLAAPRKKNIRNPRAKVPATPEPSPAEEPATVVAANPAPAPTPVAPRIIEPEPLPISPEVQPTASPKTRNPEVPMSQPNPTPISASRSIDRQLKEQKAISSLLHGAGLALVCTILFFAGLASLGGYVLYRQMQDQSATLALLEQNTKQRMFEMEMDLIKRDNDLAKNLEQANLRVTALTTQFEEYRYQTTQTLAELRSRNRELEKQLSLNQRKLSDQQSVLARLR